jgi:hypothetical protein
VLTAAEISPMSPIEVDVADWSDTEVRREWRSIDILLYSPSNSFVCTIENKVGSKEHSNQTERYRHIVNEEFSDTKSKMFVYLTPEGGPSEDATWIGYDYGNIATLTSEICESHKSSLGPEVYAVLNHYVTLLGRHIVRDSEIAELCRKIYRQHKGALDLIYEHRPDLQSDIAEIIRELVTQSQDKGIELFRSAKSYVRFADSSWDTIPNIQTGTGWPGTSRIILFDFVNSPSSLRLTLILGPGPKEIREKIFETAQNAPKVFKGIGKKLYPKWTQVYRMQILGRANYENPDLEEIEKIIREKWATFLEKDLESIRDTMTEIEW